MASLSQYVDAFQSFLQNPAIDSTDGAAVAQGTFNQLASLRHQLHKARLQRPDDDPIHQLTLIIRHKELRVSNPTAAKKCGASDPQAGWELVVRRTFLTSLFTPEHTQIMATAAAQRIFGKGVVTSTAPDTSRGYSQEDFGTLKGEANTFKTVMRMTREQAYVECMKWPDATEPLVNAVLDSLYGPPPNTK